MKRRDFLKVVGTAAVASVAARAANARVCERNVGTLRAIYPVNSIYISCADTNPADLFGFGTWVRFGNGRALVGVDEGNDNFNTVQRTGGEETHTLSIAQIPSHSHTHGRGSFPSQGLGAGPHFGYFSPIMNTGSTGGGQAHNNLQPYITVFMWRRTA